MTLEFWIFFERQMCWICICVAYHLWISFWKSELQSFILRDLKAFLRNLGHNIGERFSTVNFTYKVRFLYICDLILDKYLFKRSMLVSCRRQAKPNQVTAVETQLGHRRSEVYRPILRFFRAYIKWRPKPNLSPIEPMLTHRRRPAINLAACKA